MTPEEAQKLEPQDRVEFNPDVNWIDVRDISGHAPQQGEMGMVIASTVEMPNAGTLKCTMTVMWDIGEERKNSPLPSSLQGIPKARQSTMPCQYLKRVKNKPSVEFKRKIAELRKQKADPLDRKGREIIQPRVLTGSTPSFLDGTTTGRFSSDKPHSSPLTVEAIEKLMQELKKNGKL